MTLWYLALLLAVAVEASVGIAVAAVTVACGGGHGAIQVSVACTAAVALSDLVLIPGWVWNPHPPDGLNLLVRSISAMAVPVAAVILTVPATLLVFSMGRQFAGDGWATMPGALLFGVPFGIGGAIAGFGAALVEEWADALDGRRSRRGPHVVGGAFGVVPVLLLTLTAAASSDPWHPAPAWWPLLALMPAALVVGGAFRNSLLVRQATGFGVLPPCSTQMIRRAAVCCVAMAAVSVVAISVAVANA